MIERERVGGMCSVIMGLLACSLYDCDGLERRPMGDGCSPYLTDDRCACVCCCGCFCVAPSLHVWQSFTGECVLVLRAILF